jgi:hypothetical protein
LRVDVDEQHALLCDRKACSEIDSGGGLSHATFLVGNSNDPAHARESTRKSRVRPFDKSRTRIALHGRNRHVANFDPDEASDTICDGVGRCGSGRLAKL